MVSALTARRVAAVLLTATHGACTTRTVSPSHEVTAVGSSTGEVQSVVRLALTLDAAGDRRADTLYASEAVVVSNARVRLTAPRFAGITSDSGGRVLITATNATVEGRWAWALVDYRWVNQAERRGEVGRATFVCERRGDSWKIVHAHSSQPLPWEP
ncbi:MAG TPA: nuclear transport factor 2 family protein [Gemmatimonadales bacterium]|nr:nuclear transport factor 2 family protein [Gemmatimonadales bacterium]